MSNISITAEFVSIIKSEVDPRNHYFVSTKAQCWYNFLRIFLTRQGLAGIFKWRLHLSQVFDEKINLEKPEQVIDLAAGYTLRGFNLSLMDPHITCVDVDLPDVIARKRVILENICRKEKINFPANYFMIDTDVLKNESVGKITKLLNSRKKRSLLLRV